MEGISSHGHNCDSPKSGTYRLRNSKYNGKANEPGFVGEEAYESEMNVENVHLYKGNSKAIDFVPKSDGAGSGQQNSPMKPGNWSDSRHLVAQFMD